MTFGPQLVLLIILAVILVIITVILVVVLTRSSGCRTDADCTSSQVCQNATCKSRLGAPCLTAGDCATGLSCLPDPNRTDSLICRNPPSVSLSFEAAETAPVPLPIPFSPPLVTSTRPSFRRCSPESIETDDEQNSFGSHEDRPFEPLSDQSSLSETESETIPSIGYYQDKALLDLTSFSDSLLYLLNNETILVEQTRPEQKVRLVLSERPLSRLFSFAGYLYGLSRGSIVRLLSPLEAERWSWREETRYPAGLIDFSLTGDGEHLWLQSNGEGYIFDQERLIWHGPYSPLSQRMYGQNLRDYLEIDRETCQGYRAGSRHPLFDLCPGSFLWQNRIIRVTRAERSRVTRVVLLDWQPYLLRK